jgi:uncharacterized protein involved in exopolysaccharide biosynthesis
MSTVHSQPVGGDAVGRLLRSVWRYKGLIVAAVLLGALLGYGWAARQPTLYEGVSRMRMNRCPPNALCVLPRSPAQQLLTSQLILATAVTLSGNRISVETLRQHLEVEVAQVTDVVTVRVVDSTATGAAHLANAVPAAYELLLARQHAIALRQLQNRQSVLQARLAEAEAELARNPNDTRLRAKCKALTDQDREFLWQLRALERSRPSVMLERAAVPKQPTISPSPGREMVIGMLLGLLAAAVLVWWLTRRQGPTSRSSTPEQGPEMPPAPA